jgi:phosphate-selective porin OprO/OprP
MLAALLLSFAAAAAEDPPRPSDVARDTPAAESEPVVLEPSLDGEEGKAEGGDGKEAAGESGEGEADQDPTAKLPVAGEASAIDTETYQVTTGDAKPAVSEVPTWERILAPKEYKLFWNQGLRVERNDGYFRFKGGFRLEVDVASIHGDEGIEETIGGLGSFAEVRRAWLTVSGTIGRRVIYAAQVDVTGNSTGDDDRNEYVREIFAGVVGLGPLGTVRAGVHKEPFSLAELNSSKNLTFMERSLVATFAPGYDPGISSQLLLLDRRLTLTYGAFYYTGAEGKAASRLDLTTRVTGLPFASDDDRYLWHLGASYSHQFREDFKLRYRRRPESHLAERFVDTGEFLSDDIDLISVETIVLRGPFSVLAEWVMSRAQRPEDPTATFWGTYAEVAWFVTGEQRPYRRSQGTLGYVIPTNSFDWKKRHWGALQVGARYSHLDLDSEGIRGGILNDISLGLTWFARPHLRFMTNYVHAHLNGVGSADIIQLRFGVEF